MSLELENLQDNMTSSKTDSDTTSGESTYQQNSSGNSSTFKWNQVKKKIEPIEKPAEICSSNKNDDFFEKLSNKFVEQQDQIMNFRSTIGIWFASITALQLLVINVLIFFAIFMGQEIMSLLLDFLKYFIGATFIELLGGLLIIVKFVFSHETSDMLKHLTYVDPTSKEQK